MSGQAPTAPFYVYELFDPRDEEVFYVGKGVRDRAWAHYRDAVRGALGPKCDRIREIIGSGSRYSWRVVSRHQIEAEAYEAEAARIASYGLRNLTNVLPGGSGSSARVEGPFRWDGALLRKHAEDFARALIAIAQGNAEILGKDISTSLKRIIVSVIRDVGAEAFSRALRKHGVEVSYGRP